MGIIGDILDFKFSVTEVGIFKKNSNNSEEVIAPNYMNPR